MKGLVIRSTGSFATVKTEDGVFRECKVRGIFRMKGLRTTNPLAVGDRVVVEASAAGDYHVITEIDPRENYIIRRSINLSKEAHILAANIDQAFVIATVSSPRTSLGFIDRMLITCEAYHIPVVIVVNKCDLYASDADLDKLAELQHIYTQAGYEVLLVSAATGFNLEELRKRMNLKINLFTGHSGVGKSTLINAIEPRLHLKTGEISEVHSKGKHTTTFAELFELWENTWIIDTPGVKEFGIVDMKKEEIGDYFPEIRRLSEHCRFANCMHENEPGCAVKEAAERGDFEAQRYSSYLGLLHSEELSKESWD
jgi:ribosome biogenesis GTPase